MERSTRLHAMQTSKIDWLNKLPLSLIDKFSAQYKLDHNLVRAIMFVESGGETKAMRFESGWRYLHHARHFAEELNITVETETQLQMFSYGLMQVMGSVARELHFRGNLTDLLTPEIGLEYGCKKLEQLSKRYENENEIIVSYNGGSPVKMPSGFYRNQKYLDKVHRRLVDLRGI